MLRDNRRWPQWSDQRGLLSWPCLPLDGVVVWQLRRCTGIPFPTNACPTCFLFLNVFISGAVAVFSGNSFHTFAILIGKHSFLVFKCALSWNNFLFVYPAFKFNTMCYASEQMKEFVPCYLFDSCRFLSIYIASPLNRKKETKVAADIKQYFY